MYVWRKPYSKQVFIVVLKCVPRKSVPIFPSLSFSRVLYLLNGPFEIQPAWQLVRNGMASRLGFGHQKNYFSFVRTYVPITHNNMFSLDNQLLSKKKQKMTLPKTHFDSNFQVVPVPPLFISLWCGNCYLKNHWIITMFVLFKLEKN